MDPVFPGVLGVGLIDLRLVVQARGQQARWTRTVLRRDESRPGRFGRAYYFSFRFSFSSGSTRRTTPVLLHRQLVSVPSRGGTGRPGRDLYSVETLEPLPIQRTASVPEGET